MANTNSRRKFFQRVATSSGALLLGGEGLKHLSSLDHLLLPSLSGNTIGSTSSNLINNGKSLLQAALGEDAYHIIQNSLQGGIGLARWQTALAATSGQKPWAVVTIKVVNHVYTQLLFKFGEILPDGTVDSKALRSNGNAIKNQVADNCKNAGAHLIAKGSEKISDIPRFKKLRMSKWFADILNTGKSDTESLNSTHTQPFLANGFPAGVAFQAAHHLGQEMPGKNHSLVNFKVRATEGDLADYIQTNRLVRSPLGTTCFMMGQNYDKAEGSNSVNVVCKKSPDGKGDTESAAAVGRTVSEYVQSIEQSLLGGYSDNNPNMQENIKAKFDKLVVKEPKIREALLASAAQFRLDIQKLKSASELEKEMQPLMRSTGTSQAVGEFKPGQGISDAEGSVGKEFLAQVLYTCHSLKMAERPCRNFQLFLNTSDNDGNPLDIGYSGVVVTEDPDLNKPRKGIKAISNVEGMRQLAVGLNMLAKVIDDQKDVLVVVVSEGGRNINLTDDKQSFGIVMGPKGVGMLDDALYGNLQEIEMSTSDVSKDPGKLKSTEETKAKWDAQTLSNHYMNDAGMPATPSPVTVGDFQMGVIQFLEDVTGVGKTRKDGSKWVKLKRGA